mmetsp:Transcript_46805/g.105878  ORF Transcript_46805/g.105878 Transcript_46805/m.105878 type:complete len:327 (+) Transcript_46805:244-1224(+)
MGRRKAKPDPPLKYSVGSRKFQVALGHPQEQVDNPRRVAPLVVVPRDNLVEVGVERDRRARVHDARPRLAHKVLRDYRVGRDPQNSAHVAPMARGAPKACEVGEEMGRVHGVARPHRQVDHRHVRRRHPDGHARELALEGGEHLPHRLGRARRGRDEVGEGAPPRAPVFAAARACVHRRLRPGGAVDRSHESFDDSELVVDGLCERRQAIRRAARHRHHRVLRSVVLGMVHPHDQHRGVVLGGGGDNDLLRAPLGPQVERRLGRGGEHPSGLDHILGPRALPIQLARVPAVEQDDPMTLNEDGANGGLHVDGGVHPTFPPQNKNQG